MSDAELLGRLLIIGCGIVGTVYGIMSTVINKKEKNLVKNTEALTTLTITIANLTKQMDGNADAIKQLTKISNNHETRIYYLEQLKGGSFNEANKRNNSTNNTDSVCSN